MTCPVCQGTGEVEKRILLFFKHRTPCETCGGTGRVDNHGTWIKQSRLPADDDRRSDYRGRDDFYSSPSSPPSEVTNEPQFLSGGEGRSGGGGAGADWSDGNPVIFDPFTTGTAVATAGIAAVEAADGASSDSSGSSDSGTSY